MQNKVYNEVLENKIRENLDELFLDIIKTKSKESTKKYLTMIKNLEKIGYDMSFYRIAYNTLDKKYKINIEVKI